MKVLWLFGEEDYVTEVGAMNIFFLLEKEGGGGVELVTSPLDAGDILDGELALLAVFVTGPCRYIVAWLLILVRRYTCVV